jgi:hypothetical protein
MPPDPPLTDAERVVLDVLMAPGTRVANSTADAIADRGELTAEDARGAIRSLLRREPPLVREEFDSGLGIRFYRTTYDAAEATEDLD